MLVLRVPGWRKDGLHKLTQIHGLWLKKRRKNWFHLPKETQHVALSHHGHTIHALSWLAFHMVSPHLRRKMEGHVPLVVIFFQSDTFPKIEKCAMMFTSTAIHINKPSFMEGAKNAPPSLHVKHFNWPWHLAHLASSAPNAGALRCVVLNIVHDSGLPEKSRGSVKPWWNWCTE